MVQFLDVFSKVRLKLRKAEEVPDTDLNTESDGNAGRRNRTKGNKINEESSSEDEDGISKLPVKVPQPPRNSLTVGQFKQQQGKQSTYFCIFCNLNMILNFHTSSLDNADFITRQENNIKTCRFETKECKSTRWKTILTAKCYVRVPPCASPMYVRGEEVEEVWRNILQLRLISEVMSRSIVDGTFIYEINLL